VRRTRIVATIGPASESDDVLKALAVAGVLAPVWWGRDVLPHVVRASAATTFPVCGPAQWVLSGGAPIGSLVDGSVVQTLVLDGNGTLAITGACPAVAAKVSGTRHGTVVKAKWPQGGCGGVSGAARIGATIEPTCTTLTGRFSAHGLRQTLAATRSPCDVGLLDTGGTPRCAVPSVAIGSAEATTTLDDNGCLLSDLTLTSTTGV
jgi:hypothetical protein